MKIATGLDKDLHCDLVELIPAIDQLLVVILEKITEMREVDEFNAVFFDLVFYPFVVAGF